MQRMAVKDVSTCLPAEQLERLLQLCSLYLMPLLLAESQHEMYTSQFSINISALKLAAQLICLSSTALRLHWSP